MHVERWTGRETRMFREASRLTVRSFAEYLGVATRTVSRWELHGVTRAPQPEIQSALDTALRRADGEVRRRFEVMLIGQTTADSEREEPGITPPWLEGSPVPIISGAGSSVHGTINAGQVDDLVHLLRDQWHLLVKTDNLLGPRFALRGVLDQLHLVEEVLPDVSSSGRSEVLRMGARYAESASWLSEDSGDHESARSWNLRAGQWAREADDRRMMAWTRLRFSSQAMTAGNVDEGVAHALVAASEKGLLPVTRAAITQQAAHGFALQGDELSANRHLEMAHDWAASDDGGDARAGHGSYCTETYLELQRASCWLTLNRPERAVELYERVLPELASVYRRDRGHALSRLALAHVLMDEPGQAAVAAHEALTIARATGSRRTEREAAEVAFKLRRHQREPTVAALLLELAASSS